MAVSCALRRQFLTALLVLACSGLPGCGEDASAPTGGDSSLSDPQWSEPVAAQGSASKDASAGGSQDDVRSADELLADLRSRIAGGRGHADASYQQSVLDVAAVLWDASTAQGLLDGAQAMGAHQKVAAISGDVSRWLAAGPSARAQRTGSNPTDLAIHDAFLVASAKGAQAYRLWCGKQALALLEAHREAVYRKLMPDRVRRPRVDGPAPDAAQGK